MRRAVRGLRGVLFIAFCLCRCESKKGDHSKESPSSAIQRPRAITNPACAAQLQECERTNVTYEDVHECPAGHRLDSLDGGLRHFCHMCEPGTTAHRDVRANSLSDGLVFQHACRHVYRFAYRDMDARIGYYSKGGTSEACESCPRGMYQPKSTHLRERARAGSVRKCAQV